MKNESSRISSMSTVRNKMFPNNACGYIHALVEDGTPACPVRGEGIVAKDTPRQ